MEDKTLEELEEEPCEKRYAGELGCSNHGCVFRLDPTGQGTNGICSCLIRLVRDISGQNRIVNQLLLLKLKTAIVEMRDEIIALRKENKKLKNV